MNTWTALTCFAVFMLALWAGTKVLMREWDRKHEDEQ